MLDQREHRSFGVELGRHASPNSDLTEDVLVVIAVVIVVVGACACASSVYVCARVGRAGAICEFLVRNNSNVDILERGEAGINGQVLVRKSRIRTGPGL